MKVQLDNLEIALIRPAFSSFSLLLSSFSWEIACIANYYRKSWETLTLTWSEWRLEMLNC